MRLSKPLMVAGTVGTFIGSLCLFQTAFASAYEWITDLVVPSTLQSSQIVVPEWDTHTQNSTDYEYRTVYYYVTTTDSIPDDTVSWIETPSSTCRNEGYIYDVIHEKCQGFETPTVYATSTLWFRATTHFAGCGSYTATPNVASCGDIQQASSTVTP